MRRRRSEIMQVSGTLLKIMSKFYFILQRRHSPLLANTFAMLLSGSGFRIHGSPPGSGYIS